MSAPAVPDHVCYVHCNFCNTILVVSVPGSTLTTIVTVRCGHCGNLLSVNMGALPQLMPPQDLQKSQGHNLGPQVLRWNCDSSSSCTRISLLNSIGDSQQDMPPIHPQEKRQRAPSAYNRFIKEEIRRLKATNPDMSHREAFSAAAKNWAHFPHIHFGLNDDGNSQWAHFPHIHFGLNHDGNSQVKIDDSIAAHGVQKSHAYC